MKAQRIHQYQSDPEMKWSPEDKRWETNWRGKVGLDMAWVAGVRDCGEAKVEVSLMGGTIYMVHADFAAFLLEWMTVRGEPGA
jgi:hypothetical protein